MKLFIYDEKHEEVHAEFDLGNLFPNELEPLARSIYFINNFHNNRYSTLVLAEGYKRSYDDENGFHYIHFIGEETCPG